MKKLLITFGIGVFIIIAVNTVTKNSQKSEFTSQTKTNRSPQSTTAGSVPTNLSLPFKISDIISEFSGINPLGVVRFAQDEKSVGHGGIDFLLTQGAPVYAVADGPIVTIESASDPWGGMGIVQLLHKIDQDSGWVFIYEHITPGANIKQGDILKKGDLIATKTAPNSFTAHFQLSHAFNNYQYYDDYICWPDFLGSQASETLLSWWNPHRQSETILQGWKSVSDGGQYQFKGLLDKSKFPKGPQLCYPLGTDVRNSTNE